LSRLSELSNKLCTTHRKVHFDRNPSYLCKYCPVTFGTKHALYKHVQNLHTSEEPICCKVCRKTFKDRYCVKVHKKTHRGEKCYECALCQYSCFTKASLNSHMLIHSGLKPFQCDECQQSFRYKQALKNHPNLQLLAGNDQCIKLRFSDHRLL